MPVTEFFSLKQEEMQSVKLEAEFGQCKYILDIWKSSAQIFKVALNPINKIS